MKKMPGHPRLFRRGAVYYHRAAIPTDIRDTYPKTEETFSLRTKDYQTALRRVREAAVNVDRKFDAHRRQLELEKRPALPELSEEQAKQIGKQYYASLLEEDEQARREGLLTKDADFQGYQDLTESHEENVRQDFARGIDVQDHHRAEAEIFLSGFGIKLAPESSSWKDIVAEIQKADILATNEIQRRNRGEIVETPTVQPAHIPKPHESGEGKILLTEAVEEWLSEKQSTSWTQKTTREHATWISQFITCRGAKPLNEYVKADAREFKNVLMKLPPNWTKRKTLNNLPVDQAAEKAREAGMETMSASTVNKILEFVGSFFRWANAHYDEAPGDIFYGLKVKRTKAIRDERDPFTLEQLQAIFNAPLYTGCQSARNYATEGDTIPRDSGKFWVPLIGLFSGARLGEITQLYVEDIRKDENGIVYMDINSEGEDKRLKTAPSHRKIPAHSMVIKMGFLDYVERRRSEGSMRLFPDIGSSADGYYSSVFGKFFSRFLRSVGAKTDTNAFHSFRHNFEDACRDNGVSYEVMNALQGHGEKGMAGRYGRGYAVATLKKELEKVRYDGLDLSHLERMSFKPKA